MTDHFRDFDKDPLYVVSKADVQVLDVNCITCHRFLTKLLLSDRCEQSFKIKCRNCGAIAQGDDLWLEKLGKVEGRDH